mmetsp:Transcript_6712/g.9054  ORF Transcript_6712/g.9054 Transcript_6712/m.9054 type:complete len:94 (-) Transcript_6712:42-323(-)
MVLLMYFHFQSNKADSKPDLEPLDIRHCSNNDLIVWFYTNNEVGICRVTLTGPGKRFESKQLAESIISGGHSSQHDRSKIYGWCCFDTFRLDN